MPESVFLNSVCSCALILEIEVQKSEFRALGASVGYLFIMWLCQFHTIISTQIQTQEYTNYQSINGRVYATAIRQLQQPLQNEHDIFYIRSLVI
jgi:hypothetical protein